MLLNVRPLQDGSGFLEVNEILHLAEVTLSGPAPTFPAPRMAARSCDQPARPTSQMASWDLAAAAPLISSSGLASSGNFLLVPQ